jgi:hypothetical protein
MLDKRITMRKILGLLIALCLFPVLAQAQITSSIATQFRERTFANLPAAPKAGTRITVTDCLTTACAVGGGTISADLRWTGGAWEIIAAVGGAADLSATSSGDILKNSSGSIAGLTPTAASNGEFPCTVSGVWEPDCVTGMAGRTDSDGTAALLSTDRGKYVITSHATANAVSIAVAASAGFEAGYMTWLVCPAGAGPCTLTPTTSTINGNTTLVLNQGDRALIVSRTEDANYNAYSIRNFGTITYHHTGATGGTLADSDDWTNIYVAKFPITITQVCGLADTGTSVFNISLQGTGAIVDSGGASDPDLVAATTADCSSTFTGTRNILATGAILDFTQVTGAASGAPTHLTITISYVRR